MKIYQIKTPINAELQNIAADKSISHRFGIFSLLTQGQNQAKNYLLAEDTLNTLQIIKNLGAKVECQGTCVNITPPCEIASPNCVLDCGNSGTAMRLMIGFLAGVSGFFVLSGDKYLNKRPMQRISKPLIEIGAKIYGRDGANLAPLCIEGQNLKSFNYTSKIASAQIKTAMILAAFKSDNTCTFHENFLSRNHSENMLKAMKAPIKITNNGLNLEISPLKNPLKAQNIVIPNDPSSAFYFALAAIIVPHSKIILKNILLNPTRIQAYKILQKMGAKLTINITQNNFETIGEIIAESSTLHAITIEKNIAWLIDEAPALAIAFALAKGTSALKNAQELRVKESDRIKVMVENLKLCGINAKELEDGFEIIGGEVKAAKIKSYGDHRIAMSFAILGLLCGMEIDESECIKTSFPNFIEILLNLGVKIDH
ncbi:3-phosphoshikimate 1-carboxyvinyltransferase [Campylobacter hepaticus]|uniref:3-phosphoshikimate 1-carboxyvinyltransferase n=1 Tax=Campylobacter hepaticus TaxID=1813019 RepID=UPI0029BCF700|nr:3-phosphoshikimate 1-carboxyvinyltransferase [Campylobacter hepaticus]MDX2331204.1 3-phosphoshikimate 1-carboxyvinyltransferase [Campylobacter hepaticus]MDX2371819.1 3-phosphoshikimate 1-carboxyvinyltransferase [Campylobacter hepaticus]MDX2396976.1 3-phosphoshikimate 1-carboxyvinyltransferase [Campylobacter hepaticus]MDX5508977.1 3-phosphoshikimate 1-carboxyvinyltransferase [Campylobacter hepaticus]